MSSPIREPTADDPVKPTLSTSPSSSARSRPSKAVGPSDCTRFSTPSGSPPAMNSRASASPERGRVLGGLPDDRVAAQDRRDEVPGGHGDREVAGGDDRRDANRLAEREQLLVRHLARHRLAVQAPALGQEEVAGVDDLLDLAERLGVGLADLARDEPGERLLVVLDDPADLLDRRCRAPARAPPPTRAAPRGPRGRRPRTRRRRPACTSQTTSSRFAGLRDSMRSPAARDPRRR